MSGESSGTARRVVVVGYGPVAARLVEHLLPAIATGALTCTVVGAEPVAAYNRILLTEALAGRADATRLAVSDPAEWIGHGIDVRLRTRVVAIDRGRQMVRLDDGGAVRYDHLVLATGARAVIPALAGTDDTGRVPGVTSLRDLPDLRRVRSAANSGARVVVLGGGVLGIEAALAVAERGNETTLVHTGDHPMARQLDPSGGRLLAGLLRTRGVTTMPRSRATGLQLSGGRFGALNLHDGRRVSGDLLLLACGVRPRRELAAAAGLATDTGVLVDHRLTSPTDPSVHAIGDCAEVRCGRPDCAHGCPPPGAPGMGPAGLIGPGWAQAEVLAGVLTDPLGYRAYLPREEYLQVKAGDLSVMAIGDVTPEVFDSDLPGDGRDRPLSVSAWADPTAGRYLKVITRGGLVTGAISIGMPEAAALVGQHHDRRTPVPDDRLGLLIADGPGTPVADASGPDTVICRCNAVSRADIEHACANGARTVADLGRCTRAGTGCGGCTDRLTALLTTFSPAAEKATAR